MDWKQKVMDWKHKVRRHGPLSVWAACGLGASFAYVYPHTYGLEKYKEMMTETYNGHPVEVDSEVLVLAQEIREHFKWRQSFLQIGPDFDFIQTTQPLDFTHTGSKATRWGAVIGVPILFTTSSLLAAKENPMAVLQQYNISVNEAEDKNILELFTLSPAAKKFALAKEMYSADSIQIFTGAITINVAFLGTYAIGTSLSNILSFFLPASGAVIISFLCVIPTVGYCCVKFYDWYSCSMLAKSDRKAARMNPDVAAGGVEYYSTLIARKQALEHVPQNITSESVFDMKWRKKELTLEERKLRLQKALGQLDG